MAAGFVMGVHQRTAQTMKHDGAQETEIIEQLKMVSLSEEEIVEVMTLLYRT